MNETKSTNALIAVLKCGEYDGVDIMQAWCRLRQLEAENKALREAAQAVIEARNHESIEATPLYYLGDAIDVLAALTKNKTTTAPSGSGSHNA